MTDNVGKRRCEKVKQMDEEKYIRTDERTDGEHAADLAPGNQFRLTFPPPFAIICVVSEP